MSDVFSRLESEVCDMPRRVATLVAVFHGHDKGGTLDPEAFGRVATLLVDLEHAADRLGTAYDAAFQPPRPSEPAKPGGRRRPDLEDALTDAESDARVLRIVHEEAFNSPAQERPDGRKMVIDEDTFIAWMRACDHLTNSVKELSRVFHGTART